MSRESFEQFRSLVLEDEALQDRLRGLRNATVFAETVVGVGAEFGFDFTRAELEQALMEARRSWLERWVR